MRGVFLAAILALVGSSAISAQGRSGLEARIGDLISNYADAVVAVSIIDPATDTRISLLGDRSFHAASTMKVPVMIDVFRQAAAGRFSLEDSLLVENRFRSIVDGSYYQIEDDSDDAIYERLGRRMSVRDLVYQMITVSSNLATNLLIDFVSADSVQHTIDSLGGRHMRVLRGVEDIKAYERGLNNAATADDLALQLEAILQGRAVSAEADSEMIEILLDQRFNDMIPAALPAGARVAHKTGWITRIHHDAAIIYPKDGEPYVLVILTEGIDDAVASAALGAAIARTAHEALR